MNVVSRTVSRTWRRAALTSAIPITSTQCRQAHNYPRNTKPPSDITPEPWRAPKRLPGRGPRRRQIPDKAEILPQWVDKQTGRSFTVAWYDKGLILLDYDSGNGYEFHPTQLRDGCTCKKCRDPSSGNKTFASTEIPTGIVIKNVKSNPDEGLIIRLKRDLTTSDQDSHIVKLSGEWMRNLLTRSPDDGSSARLTARRRFGVEHWDGASFAARAHKIDYEDYMAEGPRFWDAVRDLARFGLVFLKNVPHDKNSVVTITERIANIRETFYGRTFDVKAKPQAENVAYTSGYLGLHQDLLYLDPPPQIQILHCMENSCAGGESLFSDGDRIGRMLWQLREQVPISNLAHIAVPYAYDNNGHRYARQRPLLNPDIPGGNIYGNFFWSPPFQGEFSRPLDMYRWIKAAQIFESSVNDPQAVYKTKMAPGDCVLFDNIRVLHGRTAFDAAGGSRWLRGAYISGEDFFSTASHAPASHAAALSDVAGLWDEEAHMVELGGTGWFRELGEKVRRVQDSIQSDQIDPAVRGRGREENR